MACFLSGKRVLVTRTKRQAGSFIEQLEKEGAEPVVLPLLAFEKKETKENWAYLSRLHEYSWLFFTSANGVKFFFDLLRQYGIPWSEDSIGRVASVGKKTTEELEQQGITVSFQPREYNGAAMVAEFLSVHPDPGMILLVQGNLSRQEISRELEHHRVFFHRAVVYDTLVNKFHYRELIEYIQNDDIDIYTFTSPSTVHAFEKLTENIMATRSRVKKKRLCVCIGKTTKEAAEKAGFDRILTPKESTVEGMIDIMKKQKN